MAAFDLNVERVLQRRDSIYETVFLPALHLSLDAVDLAAMVRQLDRILGRSIRSDILLESLRPVAGVEFQADTAWALAWRLAGNVNRMRRGIVAAPWTVQREREPTVWQVVRGDPRMDSRGRRAHQFTIAALTGSMCPMQMTVMLTHGAAKYIAARVGFSSWVKESARYPFTDPMQLVGLRLLGDVIPGDRRCPGPSEYRESASIIKWNRTNVLDVRLRRRPCPRGWHHPCHLCAVGYRQCLAAVHPETYVLGRCSECHSAEALFDPSIPGAAKCYQCIVRERYREQVRT